MNITEMKKGQILGINWSTNHSWRDPIEDVAKHKIKVSHKIPLDGDDISWGQANLRRRINTNWNNMLGNFQVETQTYGTDDKGIETNNADSSILYQFGYLFSFFL